MVSGFLLAWKIQTVFHNNVNSFLLSPFSFLIHIAHISVTTSHTSKCWTWCDTWLCSSPSTGDIPSGSASGNLCSRGLFCRYFPPQVSQSRSLALAGVRAVAAWAERAVVTHSAWLSLLCVDRRPFTDTLMSLTTAQSCPNRLADLREGAGDLN